MTAVLKQNLAMFLMSILVILTSHFAYRWIKPQWIVYHSAEEAYKNRQWQNAIALYKESFDLGLNYPNALLRLAESHIQLNQYSQAAEIYEDYLKKEPQDAFVLKDYAGMLTAEGKFDKAAEIYQRLLNDRK